MIDMSLTLFTAMAENTGLDSRNILINTKRKCFLCLQSIFKLSEGEIDQEIKQEFSGYPHPAHGNLVSLLSIARYLNVDPGQIISQCLKDDVNSSKVADEISNFCVSLCDDCCPQVTKLSKLCLELEVIQMKVDHQVKSFYAALECSEEDGLLVNQFQSSVSSEHLCFAEALRERMRIKCKANLHAVLPKVMVTKSETMEIKSIPASDEYFENSPPASVSPEPVSPPPSPDNGEIPNRHISWECIKCSSTFSLKTSLVRHRRKCQPFALPPARHRLTCKLCNIYFPSKPPWLKHVRFECPHRVPEIANLKPNDHYNCPLCRRRILVSQTRRHKIHHHVDSLLISYKLPHLTSKEFKEYCDHVFQVETLLCRRKSDPDGNEMLECSHCSKCYSSHYTTQGHLFLEHKHVMGKKLVELQKSTALDEIRGTELPSSTFIGGGTNDRFLPPSVEGPSPSRAAASRLKGVPDEDILADTILAETQNSGRNLKNKYKEIMCTLCDPHKKLKMRELKTHKIRLHVEFLLKSHKVANVAMPDFKLYCQQVFKKEINVCKKVYDEDGRPGWKCHCSRILVDELNLHRHFFLEHRELMEGKIAELQRTVSVSGIRSMATKSAKDKDPFKWKCFRCSAGFAQECSLRRHLKHACKLGPRIGKRAHKCEKCGWGFSYASDLKRHLGNSGCKAREMQRKEVAKKRENGFGAPVTKVEPSDSDLAITEEDEDKEELVFPDTPHGFKDDRDTEMIVPDDDSQVN